MPIVSNEVKTSQRQYTDLDISFKPHPATKDLARKVGDAAVIQSMRNLVLMNFYEKPFQPHIGSNVRKLLFENLTPINANILKDVILETLKNFEPRVTVSQVIVLAQYDQNRYSVTVEFYINNRTEPTVTTLFLERIR